MGKLKKNLIFVKKYLLYAGVDRSNLERILVNMRRANRTMAGTLSGVAILLIGVMFFLSSVVNCVSQNRAVYAVGAILSAAIFILSRLVKNTDNRLITVLVYAVWSVYYIYGIFIGAITDPTGKTVTFIVMLVFMPSLFVTRPIHVIVATTFYDALFIVLCLFCKDGSVLSVDIIDAVFYGILGIASGLIINRVKIRGYVSEQKLHEVSRIDQLTKVNNRNAFEFDLFSIADKCHHSLACLYIDVNGLHVLNNTKGHAYGDEMLKYIAKQIKSLFAEEFVYRIGGDEFVVFVPDMQKADVGHKAEILSGLVEKNGYHIATGYDFTLLSYLSVRELIKSAETEMYKNKVKFYENTNAEVRNGTKTK